ncbi:glycosyltransferase [Streptosporangium lutulentum]|uniref:Glycosyltransferase involved in cell wall biosynthesis n=2 Tax=Streptosporangium lutulentum TaxID=1461250 RepID=A0ABT9QHH9_9ACTN|nr:glycosyltransferase involved in cell wall biosynthesis [Streptosporangium lutulentum]
MIVRIAGNDYGSLIPPEIGAWTPSLRVSVVVPAYSGQEKLDLVLAGLAGQTYPAALTEIIVVDNGSLPSLCLPELRPAGTRLIDCPVPGRAHARNAGLLAATGDVIHWLDSDVVLDRRSVEAHMRWHHVAPYLVVTGYLRFTPAELPAPGVVAAADDLAKIFEPAEPHAWLVDLVERTGGLIDNPHRAFSLHVGGATSVNAALLAQTGPMDAGLILGQDTEMGYRLAQAGAVFVPEPLSRAFHLGPTMRMRDKTSIDRVSHAFVADRIPAYRWLRSHPTRQWKVPYLEVVVEPAGRPGGGYGYDEVRATVDAVLAGTLPDVVVTLTGPWDRLGTEDRAPLENPDLDLVLIRGHYAHEPKVRFSLGAPESVRPAPSYPATGEGLPAVPYRLRLPAGWVPGEDSLARLLDVAKDDGYGLVSVLLAEAAESPGSAGRAETTGNAEDAGSAGGAEGVEGRARGDRRLVTARLERAAAFARAAIVLAEGEDLDDAVEDTFGVLWVDGETYGFLPEARPVTGRRGSHRARTEAEAEVARLTKEAERLRGQVTKWRDEAGTWRRSAVELRREVGGLRKELAAARKVVQYGLLSSVKRALTRRR